MYITFYHKLTLALIWIAEIKKQKYDLATLWCDNVLYIHCLDDTVCSLISKV